MSSEQLGPEHVITQPVRLAFPALFEPKPVTREAGADLKYQAVMLLPPDYDLGPLKAAMMAAAKAEWGGKIPALAPDKNPIKPCEGKSHLKGYEPGWHYVNLKSEYQPSVVDERLQDVIDASKVFAGCWCRFHVNAYAYNHPVGGKGISFGLNSVQFVRPDERLDNQRSGRDVFTPIEVAEGDQAAGDAGAEGAPASGGAASGGANDAESLFQ